MEAQQPVQPDSLFRWCSVSKTMTAAAVMRLVEDGKLDLDAPVWNILNQYAPYNGKWGDSRLNAITVRQLLHYTGGWDRDQSGDPLVGDRTVDASNATHTSFPPTRDTVIRYMLAQKLDFTPGSRAAYCNFGYMLLGRIIEKISGEPYDTFVREQVYNTLGLPRVQLGGSTLADRLPGEVKYYDSPGAPPISSYVSPAREMQPRPYGTLDMDLVEAAGYWVGSVVDLAKFVSMLNGARPRALVRADTFASMVAPGTPVPNSPNWYGFGVDLASQLGGITWSKGGAVYGSRMAYWCFANGLSFVLLFNGDSADQSSLILYAEQAVWDALAAVPVWPEHDLFPQYYPPRIATPGVVNAASFQAGPVAPGSLVTIFGVDLGGRDAGVTVSMRDAGGGERPMQVLYSDPGQINGVLPEGSVLGDATAGVRREGWPEAAAALSVSAVSPGVFTLNEAGLAAASLVRSRPGQPQSWESVSQVDDSGTVVARPIVFGSEDEMLSLVLYCTGVGGRGSLSGVSVQVGDFNVPASYAGPQQQYAGLDQVNIALPRDLSGSGVVKVKLTVDGTASNTSTLLFR